MAASNHNVPKGERVFRGILMAFSALAVLIFVAHLMLAAWSRHSFSQVEAIVATQSQMLAAGEGLYYDLDQYPFTVNPYGPIFYSLLAGLFSLGAPILLAGRLISLAALAGTVYLSAEIARVLTANRYAAWTAALLTGTTANLLSWGNTGQTDSLALFFSIAAFYLYLRYDRSPATALIVGSGVSIALAIFVKQSFVAAGAAVAVLMLWNHRKAGVKFVAALGLSGVGLVLGLNWLSGGGYFDHAVRTNLNPFSLQKFGQQAEYFMLVSGCLLLLALAAPIATRRLTQFHLYLGLAFVVFALTASKVGSDLNYQMETVVLLCIASAWSLHRLDFFPLYFRNDPGLITLLQIPLVLYLVLNIALSGRTLLWRTVVEHDQREQSVAVAAYLAPDAGRVLSVEIDPLLSTRQHIEVEPLIYTLLVDAGVVDPGPVLSDLASARFASVALYQDVFEEQEQAIDPEIPSLPAAHLDEIRRNYRLVKHIAGPYLGGIYLYQPKTSGKDPALTVSPHFSRPDGESTR